MDVANWSVAATGGMPRQTNDVDCGVFVNFFANFVGVGAPLTFCQEDIPLFRRRMTLDTLNKKVG